MCLRTIVLRHTSVLRCLPSENSGCKWVNVLSCLKEQINKFLKIKLLTYD